MDINKFFSFTVKKLNKFSPTALHERKDISHRYYSHYTAQIYIYIYIIGLRDQVIVRKRAASNYTAANTYK